MWEFVSEIDWGVPVLWLSQGALAAVAGVVISMLTDRDASIWMCDHPSLIRHRPLLPVQALLVGLLGVAALPAAWVVPPEALRLVCAGAAFCVLVLAHDALREKKHIRWLNDRLDDATTPPVPLTMAPPETGGAQ